MNIAILAPDRTMLGTLDEYQSFIWTERYFEAGDCELYCAATDKNMDLMQAGNFITKAPDEPLCRIMSVETTTDANNGRWLLVKGQDARVILNQRLYLQPTYTAVYARTTIKNIVEDNAGVDASASRQISGLTVDVSGVSADMYYTTDRFFYCFDKIVEICRKFGYGNRLIWSADKSIQFQLYSGTDRSASQSVNKRIIFSEAMGTLASSDYIEDYAAFKNTAYIAGEGEGYQRMMAVVNGSAYSGLDRYEMFVDGSSVSRTPDQGTTLTDAQYEQVLQDYGSDALTERDVAVSFSGTIINGMYEYGNDYELGDIVTVTNPLGISFDARITEVIENDDTQNGHIYIPKFEYIRATT